MLIHLFHNHIGFELTINIVELVEDSSCLISIYYISGTYGGYQAYES